ncbi:hypothetical protein SAMN04489735_105218 [Aneurinibacillus thermoaerophilus]|uniref:Uncharacterized protein n=1 Tax=Aneurinibacillus thermoaerophilus TaxID=143495 RepID=A0A1G8F0I0_ANETH|nr:hypothetical protein SAMN04489735_105218 [Aneurinibacillus thermoaerophilus]
MWAIKDFKSKSPKEKKQKILDNTGFSASPLYLFTTDMFT